ncbi:hypothetical protein B7P43_G00827 [Cryptotermes secundus]|uniref:Uncharacterized protein n=1 Tax=Cryptotermes secundus TaxID=105785 RepID=A0A2J7PDS4_9NEOP|nr:hypothetical protein B7P43_G00827 [Cryptotermes secundus]
MQQTIELSSGVGSWENNGKKGIRLCKEDFIVCCSYSETVICVYCQETTSED